MAVNRDKLKAAQERMKGTKGENLVMITSSEMAREYQKRSVESRRRNKERLATLKSFTEDLEKIGVDVGDHAPKGIDVLRFCMVKAMHDENFDLAAQYAEKIAAYETPKLASTSVDLTTTDLSDMSDEELMEAIKRMEDEDEVQRSDDEGEGSPEEERGEEAPEE